MTRLAEITVLLINVPRKCLHPHSCDDAFYYRLSTATNLKNKPSVVSWSVGSQAAILSWKLMHLLFATACFCYLNMLGLRCWFVFVDVFYFVCVDVMLPVVQPCPVSFDWHASTLIRFAACSVFRASIRSFYCSIVF